ncbi:MAG: DUF3048 C-terminal domain-containing protein, partial [Actinomycetia bacterium]|nr:DUF3048 C-terminal domain-containing protein [Actinomycetes bacterium]
EIRAAGIDDLDEMRYGKPTYWRISSRKRPHNLYTSTKSLRELAVKKGYEDEISYKGFEFKEDNPASTPLISLTIPFSNWNKVAYKYDKETNSFLRFHKSVAHRDAYTGTQIKARNVVVLYAKKIVTNYIEDRQGSKSLNFGLTGEGKADFFIDGKEISGFWKAGSNSPPSFYADNGEEISFNAGNIWIEVVPTGTNIDVEKPAPKSTTETIPEGETE